MSENLGDVVVECATEVYNALGAGYIESVYEEAMAVEFRLRGIPYQLERTTEVYYKGVKVGTHRLDFVVDGRMVVELKAGASISKSHVAQLKSYMKTLDAPRGVVVNFPYPEKDAPDIHTATLEA